MDKQIGATIILLDETEALLIVKEPAQKPWTWEEKWDD